MDNYKSEYERGRALAEDITRAMNDPQGDLGLSDLPELEEFVEGDTDPSELLGRMSDGEYMKAAFGAFSRSLDGKAGPLENIIRRRIRNRSRNILIASVISSAAVVALAVLLLSGNRYEFIQQPYEIADADVPTLIVGDNSRIILAEGVAGDELSNVEAADGERLRYKNNPEQVVEPVWNTLIVPSMYTYEITLEDGSTITLNANTTIRYKTPFGLTDRTVELKGEAYFTVAGSEKPFIVRTEDMSIEVYGTQFNVNGNRTGVTETYLVTGHVGVTVEGQKEIHLTPRQLLSYNKESGRTHVSHRDPAFYPGWKDGLFVCRRQPLVDLLDDISAWYGVKFRHRNSESMSTVVSVVLDRGMELDKLLESLQAGSNVKITKEKDENYVVE